MDSKKIYNSTISCPICNKAFSVTKVRMGSYRVASQDSDFGVHYEGVNPILYEIFVCPHCGYANLHDRFTEINAKEKAIIATQIAPHWKEKSFDGERTLDSALDTFKLALYASQLRKGKSSEIAKLCLRIAWIYRWKSDPRENEFLKFAVDYYSDAFQNENFPLDKLDEPHCMYLIAELHRKLGEIDEAAQWFGMLFNNREARADHKLMDLAHDQYQLIKDLKQEAQ